MDIILNLLKQLASSLSPTEFLLVFGVIITTSFTIVKFIIKHMPKKGGLFGGGDEISNSVLDVKMGNIAASLVLDTARILEELNELKSDGDQRYEVLRAQLIDFLLVKKDLDQLHITLHKEMDEIKHQYKMHDLHDQQVAEASKEGQMKLQDVTQKIASQLEKIDDFVRSAIYDFKSSHKELSKDVNDISKDIALVERSIQTQINTVNAVKLR